MSKEKIEEQLNILDARLEQLSEAVSDETDWERLESVFKLQVETLAEQYAEPALNFLRHLGDVVIMLTPTSIVTGLATKVFGSFKAQYPDSATRIFTDLERLPIDEFAYFVPSRFPKLYTTVLEALKEA